jgi:deazaflavin-dependent oxidoreductase (nitroreductase family)
MLSDRFWTRVSTSMSAGMLRATGKLNVPVYRLTRGRVMGTLSGVPVLLLTSTGRRSGQPRTAPVLFLEDSGRVVVIGSNAGNANAPAWSHNLKANPDAEVEIRGKRRLMRARVTEGEERAELWRKMNEQYAGFEKYNERTSRDIAVFALEAR